MRQVSESSRSDGLVFVGRSKKLQLRNIFLLENTPKVAEDTQRSTAQYLLCFALSIGKSLAWACGTLKPCGIYSHSDVPSVAEDKTGNTLQCVHCFALQTGKLLSAFSFRLFCLVLSSHWSTHSVATDCSVWSIMFLEHFCNKENWFNQVCINNIHSLYYLR